MKIIRAAESDIPDLVNIQKEVYPETLNVKMGSSFLNGFFKAFMILPGYKAVIAYSNDVPVGFLLGYPYGERAVFNKLLRKNFLTALFRRPFLIVHKEVFKKILDNIKSFFVKNSNAKKFFDIDYSKAYYMFLIGITPGGRGLNLGRSLMLEMQSLAEADGFRYFIGSVAADNKKVLHLWNTIGYDIIDVSDDPDSKYVFKDLHKNASA